MERLKTLSFLCLLCLIAISNPEFSNGSAEISLTGSKYSDLFPSYSDVLANVSMSRIQDHVEYLGGLGSRVTGYPGCDLAATYIASVFDSISKESPQSHCQVSAQEYELTVPMDRETFLTVIYPEKKIIEAYALWPNMIETSPTPSDGIEAPLIYAGDGRLREFNNKPVEGSIVLMDFNSGDNWINAAKLGAKAVIFIAASDTNFFEARKKFLLTPLYLPRLYVSSFDGEYLKELTRSFSSPVIRIKSRMMYETVAAKNIILEIPGEINDTIVIGAHYDTWSVVPALAPGADDSTGVSSLLELARFFASHKPLRTMMFVALSGHWEALAGSRAFLDEYFFSEDVVSGEKKIVMFVGIDFSTDNRKVAFLLVGHAFKVLVDDGDLAKPLNSELVTRYYPVRSLITDAITGIESQLNTNYEVDVAFRSDGWWASIPVPYMLDSEPMVASGGMGFTIRTDDCYRIGWGTPVSAFEKVSFQNLAPQIELSACLILDLASADSLPLTWATFQPKRITVTGSIRTGFVTVMGVANTFNYTRGWYDPLPNAIVHMPLRAVTYPFAHVITTSDQNGNFSIGGIVTNLGGYLVETYAVNNETGLIEYAPDQGIYGSRQISPYARADSHPFRVNTVSFKCSHIELYDVGYAERMTDPLVYDPRFTDTILSQVAREHQVFDFKTYSAYMSYSFISMGTEPVMMIFVPPEQWFSFTYRVGVLRELEALLLNTSRVTQGEGYYSFSSEKKLIFNAFDYANDLYRLAFSRYSTLSGSMVRDAITEVYFHSAREKLDRANALIRQSKYDEAYAGILSALSWSASFYSTTFNLINGVAISTIIFFAIMIPFILLLERLVFVTIGRNRLISTILVGLATIFGFYFLHPGMRVLSNSLISLLGISCGFFFLLVLLLFGDRVFGLFKEYRESFLGSHFGYSRKGVSSTFGMCFRLSTQNMRRRKFRTTLMLTSLIIVVFSFTSMMSITISMAPRENIIYEGKTPYNGLLIKRGKITTLDLLLSDRCIDQIFVDYTLAKRAWYYTQTYQNRRVEAYIEGPSGSYNIKAVIGLTPEESLFNTVFVIEGRWLQDFDYYSCIIPKVASDAIGVIVNDIVKWGGIALRVVGIYDSSHLNGIFDIDGGQITPIRPEDLPAITHQQLPRGQQILYIPTSWENLIIVSYKLAVDLGAFVPNVALKLEDPANIEAIAKYLALNFMVQVYASHDGTTRIYSRTTLFPTMGFEAILVPMTIGLMTVLMTMLGNVHERKSEIFIFSCVGISPFSISAIFLIETLIYAVVSILVGYLVGLGLNALFISYNLLPGFYPNFTTISELLVIGLSLLVTVLSALYPSLLASKLATPSLKRKWSIPTSPVGSTWEVPFPFTFRDKNEADALLTYLAEYFRSQTDESLGRFITRKVNLSLSEKELNVNINLLPADLQIFQDVKIKAEKQKDRFIFMVFIEKLSGQDHDWRILNRDFITRIREQFLLWSGLGLEIREKYLTLAKGISTDQMQL